MRAYLLIQTDSGPLFVAMVYMGLTYRDQCLQHDQIPKFLFFAGLAGTFAAILRLSLVLKWRSIQAKYDKRLVANTTLQFITRQVFYTKKKKG